jgi:hypothetical protein
LPGEVVPGLLFFDDIFKKFYRGYLLHANFFTYFPRFGFPGPSPTMGFINKYFLRLIEAKFCKNFLLSTLLALEKLFCAIMLALWD